MLGPCQTVQLRQRASGEQSAIPEENQEEEDQHDKGGGLPEDASQGMVEAAFENCLMFKSAFSSSGKIPAVRVG